MLPSLTTVAVRVGVVVPIRIGTATSKATTTTSQSIHPLWKDSSLYVGTRCYYTTTRLKQQQQRHFDSSSRRHYSYYSYYYSKSFIHTSSVSKERRGYQNDSYRPNDNNKDMIDHHEQQQSQQSQQQQQKHNTITDPIQLVDFVIVGGGVVGSALVRKLVTTPGTQHLSIVLIESGMGPTPKKQKTKQTTSTSTNESEIETTTVVDDVVIPHPRSYALSPISLQILGLLNHPTSTTTTTSTSTTDESDFLSNIPIPIHKLTNGYYNSMQIWEENQPSSLLFTHHDLDNTKMKLETTNTTATQENYSHLGCCVEDHVLQEYLWNEIQHYPNVQIYQQTRVKDFQIPSSVSVSSSKNNNKTNHTHSDEINDVFVRIQLESSKSSSSSTTPMSDLNHNDCNTTTIIPTTLRTRLLIGADGGNSFVRQHSGITFKNQYDYHQTALTCTVELTPNTPERLRRRAYQRFLSTGPIALLPTYSPNHAVIVWSTLPCEIQKWKHHTNLVQHFNDLLQAGPERLPPLLYNQNNNHNNNSKNFSIVNNVLYGIEKVIDTIQYGTAMAVQQGPLSVAALTGDHQCTFQAPPTIQRIVSEQYTFPLKCHQVTMHALPNHQRIALIGDAGHVVHPMAGQGLNLGLQDVQALVTTIEKANKSGMDIATFISTEYEFSRSVQVTATVQGIHQLHQLFFNHDDHYHNNNIGKEQSTQLQTPTPLLPFMNTVPFMKHVKSFGMNMIQSVPTLRKLLVQTACQGVVLPTTTTTTNAEQQK